VNKRSTVSAIAKLLARVVSAEGRSGEAQERIFKSVIIALRKLPRAGLLDAMDAAIEQKPQLKRGALFLLAHLTDDPSAVERLLSEYWSASEDDRTLILQTVSIHRLVQFAPQLNRIMLEDPAQRRWALSAAAKLRQDVNLPTILELAARGEPRMSSVLAAYGREECRPYLRRAFDEARAELGRCIPLPLNRDVNDPAVLRRWMREDSLRCDAIQAARGLSKLGDREALAYLGEALFDPEIQGRNYFDPGVSRHAARALVDAFQLPVDSEDVPAVRRWWEDHVSELIRDT
jgi:hypothetical protein